MQCAIAFRTGQTDAALGYGENENPFLIEANRRDWQAGFNSWHGKVNRKWRNPKPKHLIEAEWRALGYDVVSQGKAMREAEAKRKERSPQPVKRKLRSL